MYYGEIKNCDIANGEGVRVTLFVSGCTNRCKNCFQPQTWDFCYGKPFTAETERELLAPDYINGLASRSRRRISARCSPFCSTCAPRCRKRPSGPSPASPGSSSTPTAPIPAVRSRTLCSRCSTCWYGRYVEELHDISLRFRGSSNQRIINVTQTLADGRLTLWED